MAKKYNYIFILLLVMTSLFTSCGKDDVLDEYDQFNKELAAIDRYLDDQNMTAEIEPFSLIRYVINEEGVGIAPQTHDTVIVSYTMRLLDGTEVIQESNIKVKLDELIPGWQVCLPKIKLGGKMTMLIPSFYGYGNVKVENIPRNSTLIIEAELHDVYHLTPQQQLNYDQNLIEEYLTYYSIQADTSALYNLRYNIIREGTGRQPGITSTLNVSVETYLLEERTLTVKLITSINNYEIKMSDAIEGWQILLPLIKEGGTIEMYLPSYYAYETVRSTDGLIPSNAILVYSVTLNSIF